MKTKLSRREFIVAGAGLTIIKGAGRSSRKNPSPPAKRASVLIGYGLVNLWHTIDCHELADLLYSAGCTMTEIEYVAWFNEAARKGRSIETHVELAKTFVDAMRRRNITTMISLVNWNAEAVRQQDDAWFQERLNEIIHSIGTKKVMLMGVSEPNADENGKAYRWMEYTVKEWKGLKIANGDNGRGDPTVKGFDLVDWHWCGDFDAKSVRLLTAGKPTINNTDCWPVLNPGPDRTRTMAQAALQRKANFNVYGFNDTKIDEDVIHVLGECIRDA